MRGCLRYVSSMPAAESTRSRFEQSVLGELVFVGRAGPVEWAAEPAPGAPVDDEDDCRYCPALTAIAVDGCDPPKPTLRELVARALVLVLLAVPIVLVIALAIGYAAG
jgi:hypothetical protein